MSNIIVTGTSSGFGRLIVETLAKDGHHVFAGMRQIAGRNAKAAQELGSLGARGKVTVVEMDVLDEGSVQRAVDQVAQATGGAIDAVVNNAGRFSAGVTEAYTVAEVQSLFDTNVFGVMRVNRAVLPHMRKRRAGLVVNTSSIVGRISLPCIGVYAATKFAVEALADAQRDELKSLGVDVCVIEPGAYPTEVSNNGLYAADPERAGGYGDVATIPQKMGESLGQLFSSPMAPKPQDVADAVKKLVDTPAGKRPARVVVDNLSGDPVRAVISAYDTQHQALKAAFGMG
jgi:NAD(P)-dependent dehydrogenase (short-subunit alcohol dehydrogenase family)